MVRIPDREYSQTGNRSIFLPTHLSTRSVIGYEAGSFKYLEVQNVTGDGRNNGKIIALVRRSAVLSTRKLERIRKSSGKVFPANHDLNR